MCAKKFILSACEVLIKECYLNQDKKYAICCLEGKIPFNINNFEGNIRVDKCKLHYTFLD
jgi:hypothetical protein